MNIEKGRRGRTSRRALCSLDVGRFNGERFAVMAGAGFDAAMIRDAGDGGLQERFSRVAYGWTGSENLRSKPFRAEIRVDGVGWYKGKASCILVGNVGKLFGGIEAFEDARPDDGKLELGVVTAEGLLEWGRMIARTAVGTASKSPFAQTTKARSVKVKLNRKSPVRARRRGSNEGEGVQGQGRGRPHHGVRSGRRLVSLRPPTFSGRALSEKTLWGGAMIRTLRRFRRGL